MYVAVVKDEGKYRSYRQKMNNNGKNKNKRQIEVGAICKIE